jgi:hypothetical protein
MFALTVTQYLAALPADRRAALSAVHKVINENLPDGYEEGMQFGMIGWYVPLSVYPAGHGENPKVPLPLVALASQKSGMVLHFGNPIRTSRRLRWCSTGKVGRDGTHPSISGSHLRVDFGSGLRELRCLLFQSLFDRSFFCDALLFRVTPNIFCDAHAAKVRTAHRTKVRGLCSFRRQSFVVELAGGFGIEREVELILPPEFEARFADGVVAVLRAGMAFG